MSSMSSVRCQRGFTLIELLITVGLITTIAFLSAAFYSRFFLQQAVIATTDQLIGSLRKAQLYSMEGRQNDQWGVHVDSSAITLFKGAALGANPAFNEVFDRNANITISGLTEVTFTRATGTPSSALTITISSPNNDLRTVTMNSQGVISR